MAAVVVVLHTLLELVFTFPKLIENHRNPLLVLLGQNVVEKSRLSSSYREQTVKVL